MNFEAVIKIDERKIKEMFAEVGIPSNKVVLEYHSHYEYMTDKYTILSIYFQQDIPEEKLFGEVDDLVFREIGSNDELITDTYIDYSFDDNLPYFSVHFKFPLEPVF